MSAKKTDISQIRKYLNGELDARAMHKLERKAQDDPFLMDAIEGYAGKKGQQANLDDLQHRLAQRINKGNSKVITLWPLISIAATVLVFIGFGAWWMLVYQPTAKTIITAPDKTAVALAPVAPKKGSAEKIIQSPIPQHHEVVAASKPQQLAIRLPAPVVAEVASEPNEMMRIDEPVGKSDVKAIAGDSAINGTALNEVSITGFKSQRKKDITGSISAIQAPDLSKQLQGRVEGVTVTSPSFKQHMDSQLIVGQVVSKDGNQPLPGVSVGVSGKRTGTLTDASGRFKIAASKEDKLNLGYIGYEPQTIKVKSDSLNIALNPSNRSLAEVVVTGYGTSQVIEEAHPVNGWKNFDQYISEHTDSPDGKIGVVRVKFTVNADNSLSDFKITKSLSAESDAEAIRIIKDGPNWIHNVNGEPEAVTVKITFKK